LPRKPKNKAKQSKPAQTSLKPLPESPLPEAAIEIVKSAAQLKKLQVTAYARALTPIPLERRPQFIFITKEDIVKFQACLMELNMDRLLSGHDMVAQNQGVRNIVMVLFPPQHNVTVVQAQGPLTFQGVKIENAGEVDEVVRLGGVEYAATDVPAENP
jgi:hypothetical protein